MNHTKITEAHKLISQGHALLAEAHADVTAPAPTTVAEVAAQQTEKKTRAKKVETPEAPQPETKPATPPQHEGKTASERALVPGPSGLSLQEVRDLSVQVASDMNLGPNKVKGLLLQFNAGRVSELKESDYPAYVEGLKALLSVPDGFFA